MYELKSAEVSRDRTAELEPKMFKPFTHMTQHLAGNGKICIYGSRHFEDGEGGERDRGGWVEEERGDERLLGAGDVQGVEGRRRLRG